MIGKKASDDKGLLEYHKEENHIYRINESSYRNWKGHRKWKALSEQNWPELPKEKQIAERVYKTIGTNISAVKDIVIRSPAIMTYSEHTANVHPGANANPADPAVRKDPTKASSQAVTLDLSDKGSKDLTTLGNAVKLSRDGSAIAQGGNPSSARITKTLDELANDVIEFAGRFSAQNPRSKPEDYKGSYLPDPRIEAALLDLNWMEPDAPGNYFITERSIVFTEPGKYHGTEDFMQRIPDYNPVKNGEWSGGVSDAHYNDWRTQTIITEKLASNFKCI